VTQTRNVNGSHLLAGAGALVDHSSAGIAANIPYQNLALEQAPPLYPRKEIQVMGDGSQRQIEVRGQGAGPPPILRPPPVQRQRTQVINPQDQHFMLPSGIKWKNLMSRLWKILVIHALFQKTAFEDLLLACFCPLLLACRCKAHRTPHVRCLLQHGRPGKGMMIPSQTIFLDAKDATDIVDAMIFCAFFNLRNFPKEFNTTSEFRRRVEEHAKVKNISLRKGETGLVAKFDSSRTPWEDRKYVEKGLVYKFKQGDIN